MALEPGADRLAGVAFDQLEARNVAHDVLAPVTLEHLHEVRAIVRRDRVRVFADEMVRSVDIRDRAVALERVEADDAPAEVVWLVYRPEALEDREVGAPP